MLPGPWHDSHPTFLALSPDALSRACVAVLKSRTIWSWHWAQVCDPTNSAPGIFGGASTVRLTVAQEMAINATANTTETASSLRRMGFFFLESPCSAGKLSEEKPIGFRWMSEGR